jgi:RNA polymerase sigma-70 factor (ECF subfamily)
MLYTDADILTTDYLSPTEEEAAIEQALNQDLNAFNRLVEAYQRLAYSVAYRMLQDDEQAADAVQESFIKAYRALHTFQGGSFKSWLMRIVTNTCYDALRARKRRATDSLDDLPPGAQYAPYLTDSAESPHEYAERMELNHAIESNIAKLPEDQRLAVLLCDVHGYTYEEITEIANIPMGTVKSRISRGRARLRELLLAQPELLPTTFRPNA